MVYKINLHQQILSIRKKTDSLLGLKLGFFIISFIITFKYASQQNTRHSLQKCEETNLGIFRPLYPNR